MKSRPLMFLTALLLSAAMLCFIVSSPAASATLDTGFKPVLATAGQITGIVPLTDSKVLVIGSFASISGVARKNIDRLNADGSVDNGFQLDSRIQGDYIYATAVQGDGKILIGTTGYATLSAAYAAAGSGAEIRLVDGTLGESFTVTKNVTLKGGYNASFGSLTGLFTILNTPLTVNTGTLTIDRITVK